MDVAPLLRLVASGKDSALMRVAIGRAYLRDGTPQTALEHLQKAVELDPWFAPAWRELGMAHLAVGQADDAKVAFNAGLEVARERKEHQLAKELEVRLRRLDAKSEHEGTQRVKRTSP